MSERERERERESESERGRQTDRHRERGGEKFEERGLLYYDVTTSSLCFKA